MAIKPILFNTEMVRAILDGRKSCTRRLVKTRRKDACGFCVACGFYVTRKTNGSFTGIYEYDENEIMFDNPLEPPYQPGDILYVRETWSKHYVPDENGKPKLEYCYKADGTDIKGECLPGENNRWYPSIHMPKEATRIWLKITDVRVEQLQSISGKEILKEGVNSLVHPDAFYFDMNQRELFESVWNSTIKKADLDRYGWNANPWVWVIEFERCERGGIDG